MVWYSGTIRGMQKILQKLMINLTKTYFPFYSGAIAFGLTLMIESDNLNVLLNIVLLIIIFSTVVLGSLLQVFGRWIGLQPEKNDLFDVYLNASFSKKVQSISDYGEIGYYNKDLKSKLSLDTMSTSPVRLKSNGLNA